MLKLGSTPDKREQYRLMRDAMEKRFIRVTRGSIIGGVRLGLFTATFYGLQNLLAEKRGVLDVFNIAGAGSATAATFGLLCTSHLLFGLILLTSVVCFSTSEVGVLCLKMWKQSMNFTVLVISHSVSNLSSARIITMAWKKYVAGVNPWSSHWFPTW